MTPTATEDITVTIQLNENGTPTGKLADAELHFHTGPMAGLKLMGFVVWERRTRDGQNVTFPAKTYSVNCERRSFSLLRPASDVHSQDGIRQRVLDAYAATQGGK